MEALRAVESALRAEGPGPFEVEALLVRAGILLDRAEVRSGAERANDLRRARENLDRVLARSPNLPRALQSRARLESLAGRPEAARAAAEAAAAGNPLLAEASR